MSSTYVSEKHKTRLTLLTLALHVLVSTWVIVAAKLPSFDSSASTAVDSAWERALLRWDMFHFLHIARSGYEFEYDRAFFPGAPRIMKLGSSLLEALFGTEGETWTFLLTGHLATAAAAVGSVRTLYDLTLHHFESSSMAFLVSILSLMSSSPATLRFAPYAEPFFTYFTYKGASIKVSSQLCLPLITPRDAILC